MSAKQVRSAVFTLFLLPIASCDAGGPSVPLLVPLEGSVEGVVTLEDSAFAGILVRLTGESASTAVTDDSGSYRFGGLRAGAYIIELAQYPDDVEFGSISKTAALSPQSPAAQVDFHGVWKREATISATVRADGQGLEGVALALSGLESRLANAGPQGTFNFTQLRQGSYTIEMSGFDPNAYSFPSTVETVEAENGRIVEVLFTGTALPQVPAAPSGLVAVSTGSGGVDLSWADESDNETDFRVERSLEAEGVWGEVGATGADATSYADSGLDPGTHYAYRIRACNADACSAYSNETNATTSQAAPVAPSGLNATATGSASVDLGWADESDNETQFRVERKEGVGGAWGEIGTASANSTAYADAGLSPNTLYVYRVRACGASECSGYSIEAGATTIPAAPAAPSALSTTATGTTTVDLAWTDQSDNETQFRVERKEGAGGTWDQIGTPVANTTAYSDTGLSPNTTYVYRVQACNGAECSAHSNEVSATTLGPVGPNLAIGDLYITQSTQSPGGGVPLVQGKAGYLRVFALASEANSFQPTVRVSFYLGGSLAQTETILAPGSSVPTTIQEGSLGASWNVDVPGSLIQPGLSILAQVDPGNQVAESNESDNAFPASGSPGPLDVRPTAPFNVTFVPVRQSVNNRVGSVGSGNAGQFTDLAMRIFPLGQADLSIHAEYVTNAPVLQADNANGAWGTILSEINTLRVTEGSSRQYYGVVSAAYTSGVAGMGYVGWPTAVGWDRLPSGSSIAAHEWGHNWNLRHAPGCGAGDPDPAYPYGDGKIGVWGLDVGPEALKSPSTYYDIMSYCGPEWISDYSYRAVLDFRQGSPAFGAPGAMEPSLLVWGRVEGDRLVL
ncbi:fibronectin type III domain-containing protein, partial [Gemmatimonadota bacterium]